MSDQGPDWEQIEIDSMDDAERARELRELRADVEMLKLPTGEVKRLTLHPGDRVVLELDDPRVSRDEADHIREMLRQRFPDNEVLIVAGGTLKVIGPDEPVSE